MTRLSHLAHSRKPRSSGVLLPLLLLALGASGCAKKASGGEVPTSAYSHATSSSPQGPAAAPALPQGPRDPSMREKNDRTPEKVEIKELPVPPKATTNPLIGKQLFVDDEAAVYSTANGMRAQDPEKAKILDRIALQPQAFWIGDWNQDIFRTVQHFVNRAMKMGTVPVMVAYNVPHRDCGQHSKGGLGSKAAYQEWIRRVALGIGDRPAAVVLEPDALGHLQECLTKKQITERFEMIADAVRVLRNNQNTAVYIDAGHARWIKAPLMAERLEKAGIESAHGFALNVSNYVSTEENSEYGKKLSELTGGSHFVIDTSRNGNGPAPKDEWCNPKGRKIGRVPTTDVADPVIDAYLWLKRPGESDGECNGGPKAGAFWLEGALELAKE